MPKSGGNRLRSDWSAVPALSLCTRNQQHTCVLFQVEETRYLTLILLPLGTDSNR